MTLQIRIIAQDNGGYLAACLSLPGCSTRGKTREEARRNLDDAVLGYLASVGNFVPANLSSRMIEL